MIHNLIVQLRTIKTGPSIVAQPRNYKTGRWLTSAVKNWPLWSLFAVALSLSVVLAVPDFRRVMVPSNAVALTCAVIVAWIFVLSRAIAPTLNARLSRLRTPGVPRKSKCSFWRAEPSEKR